MQIDKNEVFLLIVFFKLNIFKQDGYFTKEEMNAFLIKRYGEEVATDYEIQKVRFFFLHSINFILFQKIHRN